MTNKLKILQDDSSWEQAENSWDKQAREAATRSPLKNLKQLPNMVGITEDTAKGLKWKSLKWMIAQDKDRRILKGFLKRPFTYGWAWLKSVLRKKPYLREGDFFLYGIKSLAEFEKKLANMPEAIFVVGFSYCHKPFECPSGRFTDKCQRDPSHDVCRQCFIGKAVNFLPEERCKALFIPTIHYIGGKIFDIIEEHPGKPILFMITACELTLEMFGDWGNMVDIQGIGVRLDGRICNTMKAFELSEQGIKPGLTVVKEDTQARIMSLIRMRKA